MGARDTNDWNGGRCYNYIELKKGTDSKVIDEKIRHILKKYSRRIANSEVFLQNIQKDTSVFIRKICLRCQWSLGDITVCKNYGSDCCFNPGDCLHQLHESLHGTVCKTMQKKPACAKWQGQTSRKLIVQFLGESLMLVCVAHVIAMILVELLLPAIQQSYRVNIWQLIIKVPAYTEV